MKTYFSHARIVGVDINKGNLRKANARNLYKDVLFRLSTPENIKLFGNYDVIFALSVLCRWEDTKGVEDCKDIYSFDKFSETVKMLCSHIKSGGLFVIYNSNFRFEDTDEFQNFTTVATPSVNDSGFVHKFDSNNKRSYESHRNCVFRKRL